MPSWPLSGRETIRLLLDLRLLRLGRLILDLVSTSSWYIWYVSPDVLLSIWQVLAKRPWFQMERLLETPQSVLESPKLNMTCDTATRVASYKTRQRQRQDKTSLVNPCAQCALTLFHDHVKTCQNIRSCLDIWRSSARHGQTERQ